MNANKCRKGDTVLYKGEEVAVVEVLNAGTSDKKLKLKRGTRLVEGKKAIISVCRILDNDQVLTRSPFYIGDKWEHVS